MQALKTYITFHPQNLHKPYYNLPTMIQTGSVVHRAASVQSSSSLEMTIHTLPPKQVGFLTEPYIVNT